MKIRAQIGCSVDEGGEAEATGGEDPEQLFREVVAVVLEDVVVVCAILESQPRDQDVADLMRGQLTDRPFFILLLLDRDRELEIKRFI